MEIEIVKKEGLARIQALAKIVWPPTFSQILSAQQISYMLESMYNLETLSRQFDDNHLFYVAVEKGIDLGFMAVQPHFPFFGSTKLHKIYIHPAAQGTGLGKMLIQQAEKIALENKTDQLVLNVNRFNSATHFYLRIGFEIVKEENIDIGEGYWMEDYVLQKRL
jgi:diamine N-acetyltransferase